MLAGTMIWGGGGGEWGGERGAESKQNTGRGVDALTSDTWVFQLSGAPQILGLV